MKRFSIMIAIIAFLTLNANAAEEPARMNSSGHLLDIQGNVIAIPSTNDSRNTDFKRYYKSVDSKGNTVRGKDYYITNDPLRGIIRHSVEDAAKPAANANANQPQQNQQNGMVRKYDGSQTLHTSPDAPIYNNVNNNIETIY